MSPWKGFLTGNAKADAMRDIKTFSIWPQAIHETQDQEKRLKIAKSSKTTPASIDKENQTAIFPSSGKNAYKTTLESCSCGDFISRRRPCKHIYRLAIELGLLDEAAESGLNRNLQMPLEEAVAELENLTDEAQISVKEFLYESLYGGKCEFPVLVNAQTAVLKSCDLLETVDSLNSALRVFKRNQTIKILDEHNIKGFKRKMKRDDLISWCIENIPDPWSIFPEVVVFRFSERFERARRTTYQYLLRKYDWDLYFDENAEIIKIPHGAVLEGVTVNISPEGNSVVGGNPSICNFPDDRITKLLTLYGHNRCLNGYDLTKQDIE